MLYNKNMKIKLKWHQTSDELLFDIINQDIAVWFVEQSQILGENKYSLGDQVVDLLSRPDSTEKLIKEEKEYIAKVNQKLSALKMPLFKEPKNYYDQQQLNHLHKDWADTRKQWPKLTELFYKMDNELFEAYQEMNCHIHFIEQSFKYKFRDPVNWRVQNPFKSNSYDWESSNLYIEYPGHGRCAIEKFQFMDTGKDIERDNTNWDNVDAFIGMHLNRPYKMNPPPEFLTWCQEKNLVPSNYNIPLANLTNWKENLTKARQVVTENVTIQDNYFSLHLIN
jgi:hypothetical protein